MGLSAQARSYDGKQSMNADTTAKCAYLFETLKKHRIKYIEIEFHGSGDDGQMEWGSVGFADKNVSLEDSQSIWDSPTIFCWGGETSGGKDKGNMTIGELVDEIAEQVIDFYDIDYCNNEGNNGSIVFDVETGKIATRYQVYETKEENLYI